MLRRCSRNAELDLTYQTVRRWVNKFGPLFARELRTRRPRPTGRWHLDEIAVTIAGKRHWLWRAVDDEGEVLDILVQSRRDTKAAVRLMRKLIRKLGFAPELLVTAPASMSGWKDAGRIRLWTRQANDMTCAFARITAAVASLKPNSVTLDGEAVVFRPDGHSDFEALRSRRAADAILVAFDLPERDGTDLRPLPIEDRRAKLKRMLRKPRDGLLFSELIEAEGSIVFEHACAMGLEGIVSKRRGSPYQSG